MKKKTIQKVLDKKFNELLESITEEKVRKLVKDNSIITGGCIASMLLKEPVNDFDLYFTDIQTTFAVAHYYTEKFKENNRDSASITVEQEEGRVRINVPSAGIASDDNANNEQYGDEETEWTESVADVEKQDKEAKRYRPIFLSSNAVTLSDNMQIVIRFYGDPETIHQHYDYVHCMNYWTSKDKKVVLKTDALEALLAKELIYVGSKYPICSMIRTRKFIKRGYTINAGQYLKMAFQVSLLDLQDIVVLEDQLIGVDVTYFHMLIESLKAQKKVAALAGNDFKVSYSYIAEIIDRIF